MNSALFDLYLWGRERLPPPDPPGTVRCRLDIGNPTLVMRRDGLYDVVCFGPYRRVEEGLTRERAERAARDWR